MSELSRYTPEYGSLPGSSPEGIQNILNAIRSGIFTPEICVYSAGSWFEGEKMEDIELIYNIGNIILEAETYEKALEKIVAHLNLFLESDVCSIYLYNRKQDKLLLVATKGLLKEAIGNVSMRPGEGLTGKVFSANSYQFIQNASRHPDFKYFPGIGEEPFNTYIGIPLKDRTTTYGVLVFQFRENKDSNPMMKKLLNTVASIVSGMVIKYNITEQFEEGDHVNESEDMFFNGLPLSEGIAIGTPVHLIYQYIESSQDRFDPVSEKEKLDIAFEKTRSELKELIAKIEGSREHISSDIFHGHLLMLQDPSYKKEILHHIVDHNKGAAFSIRFASNKFIRQFKAIPDSYLRERAADVEDICHRLLSNLGVLNKTADLKQDSIIISDRLTPGETASLDMEKVIGFVTQKDGPASHTAILARNRQIPAVSGIDLLLKLTEFARTIIVDGFKGRIIINPSEATIKEYREKQLNLANRKKKPEVNLAVNKKIRNRGIRIMANVSSILDAEKASALDADGIGLVRTEIFYLQKHGEFSYQEQVSIYRQILRSFTRGPTIFRLLDLGADKRIRADITEDNPALGIRGIRLLFKESRLFEDQVRALLNVSGEGDLKILVPFITEAEELFQARELIRKVAEDLDVRMPPIGVMIEIPSAVFLIEELLPKVDFFSIGTNDLFQYFCAVDRNNPFVSHNYHPDSQSFIRMLDMIYQQTRYGGKPVEICGEIAADPTMLSILLNIGFRHFSINPYSIISARNNILTQLKSNPTLLGS